MKIYNDGENSLITSKGRLDPKKVQELSDDEGKRLLNSYSTLKDAKKIGEEQKAPANEEERQKEREKETKRKEKEDKEAEKEKGKGKGKGK